MTTTNLQEEWIREIRERLGSDQSAQPTRDEADCLLSLINTRVPVDSQGTGDDVSHCALCEDPSFLYRDCVLTAKSDAATQMRTACVEKVKEMRDQHNRDYEYWKSIASNPDTDFGVLKFAAWAGEDERVITELESLTLEVKQK